MEPPTNAPSALVPLKGPENARLVVATPASALVPLPYKSCDAVNVPAPVPPPATERVPERVGVNVNWLDPLSVMATPSVWPF